MPFTSVPGPSITMSSKRITLRLVDHREGHARRPARGLPPPREQFGDPAVLEISFDLIAALAIAACDAALQLERNGSRQCLAHAEAEAGAPGIVECRLDAHLGVGVAGWLAVIDRCRQSADFHIAPGVEALRIRRQLERGGFDLLSAHPFLSREVGDVGVDRVVQIVFAERTGKQVVERDLSREISFGGRGIECDVRRIAQPFHRKQLGRGVSRTFGAEAGARGRRLGMRVRHLEYAIGQRQLAPGRQIDDRLADAHGCGASLYAGRQIGVAQRWQIVDSTKRAAAGHQIDRQAVVGERGPSRLQGRERRVGCNHEALDRAAADAIDHPGAQPRADQRGPQALECRHRHTRAGDAEREARVGRGKIDRAG